MLYSVFLHELGHLQVVKAEAKTPRRRFAGETKAQQFADLWRKRLWSERFDHPDPIHNSPTDEELERLDQHEIQETVDSAFASGALAESPRSAVGPVCPAIGL